MHLPNAAELRSTFEHLRASSYKGMPGVLRLQGETRRKFLLTVLTHGNEPSGLAAAHHLLSDTELQKRLKGDVFIAVNNMKAGEKYFESKTEKQKRECRRYQMNMNRIPEDVLDRRSTREPYEIRRVHQLYPLYKDIDVGLDMHSFSEPSEPMIIDIKGTEKDLDALSDGIPLKTRVTNIVSVQTGYAMGSLYGGLRNTDTPVIEVESGQHEDPASNRVATESAVAMLIKSDFLDSDYTERSSYQLIHRVIGSVKFPDLSYALTKKYQAFEPISEGEVIAKGNGKDIVAALDCHPVFGTSRLKMEHEAQLKEEKLFLAAPVRRRVRKLLIPQL